VSGSVRRRGLQRTLYARSLVASGVGGATWTVTRAATLTAGGSVTGYAYQEQLDTMDSDRSPPGLIRAPSQLWRFVLVSGTLQSGDALTSAADSTIRFTVQQPEPGTLYPTAIIEPIGSITITTPDE